MNTVMFQLHVWHNNQASSRVVGPTGWRQHKVGIAIEVEEVGIMEIEIGLLVGIMDQEIINRMARGGMISEIPEIPEILEIQEILEILEILEIPEILETLTSPEKGMEEIFGVQGSIIGA